MARKLGVVTNKTQRIAEQIAKAEGFYVPDSRAQKAHNPGNMKLDLINRAIGKDAGGIIRYATDFDGWENLYAQVNLILNDMSGIYTSRMTIAQIAPFYTGNDNAEAWASIVAGGLGVSVNTPIGQV